MAHLILLSVLLVFAAASSVSGNNAITAPCPLPASCHFTQPGTAYCIMVVHADRVNTLV